VTGGGEPLDAASVLRGEVRAVARALTLVEGDPARGPALLASLAGHGRHAHRVGVTGPPGAGKSTLVSGLAASWRGAGRRVGILAVDPTSPFTGGALLGDRIRMGEHHGDEGVFIRSLASRGALGGVSAATADCADVLEAAGFDVVLVETVGVGQGEVEVARRSDTTVVVLAPGAGDEVQGMKAGLLEVADVVVVNQADREGADALAGALEGAFALRSGPPPPLVKTVATTGRGVEELRVALDRHREEQGDEERSRRRVDRARHRIRDEVDRRRQEVWWSARSERLDALARAVADGTETVGSASARLLGEGR
jgi:LAO/AO transport system kinase